MMHAERFTLQGRECFLSCSEKGGAELAICLCGGGMERWLPPLCDAFPTLALYGARGEWERDYTPWPAAGLPGRPDFAGGARAHLRFLTDVLTPYIAAQTGARPAALVGYSLGGLFALWGLCNTGVFPRFGSISGSLWYPGWLEYLAAHPPGGGAEVYLSLGRDEARAGPAILRTVEASTQRTAALLQAALGEGQVRVERNRGGHFTGVQNRWMKALRWAQAPLPGR